jgi:hypothetical protein
MTSTQNINNIVDYYGAFTYKDPLIWFQAENIESWQHRQFRMDKDAYIKTYIHKLDCEIFSDKPKFTPNIFGQQVEDVEAQQDNTIQDDANPINIDAQQLQPDTSQVDATIPPQEAPTTDVTDDWETEKWNKLFIEMFDKCRGHRFCVIDLYQEPPFWKVYYEREIKEIYYDEYDNPIGCHVEWGRNLVLADEYEWFEEDLTFYNPNNESNDGTALLVCFGNSQNGKLGELDLEDVWTTAIYINYIDLEIKNNSKQFLHVKYGDALNSDNKQSLINTFDVAGSTHSIGAKETALKEIIPIAMAKPEYCIEAKQEMLQKFAATCRLPLMYFRSESDLSKAFGMSGQDDIRVTKKKLFLFGEFFPYIKTLIKMRWDIDIDAGEPYSPESEMETLNLKPTDRNFGNNDGNSNNNNNFNNNKKKEVNK